MREVGDVKPVDDLSEHQWKIYVLTAGPGLTQVSKNDMKEVIMATPAISDGVIVVRPMGHLYGIGE